MHANRTAGALVAPSAPIESVIVLVETINRVLVDVLADGDIDDLSRDQLALTVRALSTMNAELDI